jgi:hypothetical protein
MISETDWAYFAGMLDGEGHLGIFRHYKTNSKDSCSRRGYEIETRMGVSNMNHDNIKQLQLMIGLGNITLINNKREYGVAVVSDLRFGPNNQREILPKVIPYLQQKKEQAQIIVEFLNYRSSILHNKKDRTEREQKYYEFEQRFEAATIKAKPWFALPNVRRKGRKRPLLTAPTVDCLTRSGEKEMK